MGKKELRFRCWVEIDGQRFFGPGPAQLMELIEAEGSIAKAAKRMGMSYKKAWDLVSDLNSRGTLPFVISRKGGGSGGGAELTEHGKIALEKYRELLHRMEALMVSESVFLKSL